MNAERGCLNCSDSNTIETFTIDTGQLVLRFRSEQGLESCALFLAIEALQGN